jgi:exopolysaccharide production protein ExoQ
MPPVLASCLCAVAIVWLLWRDMRQTPGVSYALWIPLTWMAIIASRLPSEWQHGGSTLFTNSADAYLDGSPIDRNIFLLLIALGAAVLLKRAVSWQSLLKKNPAIVLFFLYTVLSLLWSDFPLTAFKRWSKVLGHIVMALVVFTEAEPAEAFRALFRRCGYVLLPVSVLFIKYYPQLGRAFDVWTGVAVNMGVTTNKNALGNLCLIMGLFFLSLLFAGSPGKRRIVGLERYVYVVFLGAIGWLLSVAHSASSVGAAMLGALVIVGSQLGPIRRHFSVLLIVALLIVGTFVAATDMEDDVIVAMGRDTTLTGRTELWDTLRTMEVNPLVGAGFESFWLGGRVEKLWDKFWWRPNQAHNGYYEAYLNLGLIGLFLQCAMILSCYLKARRQMLAGWDDSAAGGSDFGRAQFTLAFVLALIVFNLTDATFKGTHLSFFVFFVIALEYHVQRDGVPVYQGATVRATGVRGRPWIQGPATTAVRMTGRVNGLGKRI